MATTIHGAPGRGERQLNALETRQQTSLRALIKRHAVLTYVTLVFALTLGPWCLALITASPGAFPGTGDELTPLADPDPLMLLAWLVGTASPALAGILVIALAYGRVGLRDLRSQLFRWRVGVRWYAVALLTVPLLMTAILGALSITSQAFLPTIITAEDKARLLAAGLVGGLVVGLVISFFEEIGWTGFATHELRKRHGLLATGLILGLPWGVMHLPFYAETASGAVPPALEVAVIFFYFVPYRMLMVWVYDHTQSVLIAMLMHLPLIVFLFTLLTPAMAEVPEVIFNLVFGATLWVVVAAVGAADRRSSREENTRVPRRGGQPQKLSRGEHTRPTPGLPTRRRSA
jgi:membrane protease YdiL (CAAX protease family)